MSIFRSFNISMIPGKPPLIIHVSQYESDFVYTFNLVSGKSVLAIPDTAIAVIRGTKRDGNGFSKEASLDTENNKVVVIGEVQMTACAGRNVFELAIINDEKVICTANFFLDVERAPLDSDTIQSETVLHDLQAIINSAATATQAAEEASASAESAASAAEQAVEEKFEDGVAETIDEWLTNHPEATTTVQDGAITEAKINSSFLQKIKNTYVTPEMFGAVGDGVTDDTQALQDAIDYALENDIAMFASKNYATTATIVINLGAKTGANAIRKHRYLSFCGSRIIYSGTDYALEIKDSRYLAIDGIDITSDTGKGISIITETYLFQNNYIQANSIAALGNAVTINANSRGVLYNKFVFNFLASDAVCLALNVENNGNSYINENLFYGCACTGKSGYVADSMIKLTGALSSRIDGNKFYNFASEQSLHGLNIECGRNNTFYGFRMTENGENQNIVTLNGNNVGSNLMIAPEGMPLNLISSNASTDCILTIYGDLTISTRQGKSNYSSVRVFNNKIVPNQKNSNSLRINVSESNDANTPYDWDVSSYTSPPTFFWIINDDTNLYFHHAVYNFAYVNEITLRVKNNTKLFYEDGSEFVFLGNDISGLTGQVVTLKCVARNNKTNSNVISNLAWVVV